MIILKKILFLCRQEFIQGFERGGGADYFVLETFVFHLRMILEEISGSDHKLTVVILFAGNGAARIPDRY